MKQKVSMNKFSIANDFTKYKEVFLQENASINLSIPSRYSQTKVPTLKALQISKSLQLETHMEFEFPTAS